MLQRTTVLALVAASSLFACSGASYGSSDDGSSAASSKRASAGDDDDDTTTASTGAGIDGTWDITAAGSDAIGASQMTIKGGTITGAIVERGEGLPDPYNDACTISKNRRTFSFTVSGDTMTGTVTREWAYVTPGVCGDDSSDPGTFIAVRTHDAKNAAGQTALEGTWTLSLNDQAIAIDVAGLVAKVYDQAKGDPSKTILTTSVKSGAASTTSDDDTLTFAARKR